MNNEFPDWRAPRAQSQAPADSAVTDVLVLGGGLLGCAAAYYLGGDGVDVVVAERGDLSLQASSQNAGSLHFQMEYRMIEAGLAASQAALRAMPLHLDAIDRWAALQQALGTGLGVRQKGGFMLAETAEQEAVLTQKCQLERQAGLDVRLLDGAQVRAMAPYLSDTIRAAAYCPQEGKADPRRAALTLAQAVQAQGGRIRTHRELQRLERHAGQWVASFADGWQCRADQVLIAAGAWSGRIARMTDAALPISPIALTMTATARTAPFMEYLFQHVGRRLSLKQTAEGTVLIGGGWPSRLRQQAGIEDLDSKPALIPASMLGSIAAACAVVPALRKLPVLRCWTGMATLIADQLPLIGQVPRRPGLYIATGGSAFTLGPTYAYQLTRLMQGRTPELDITAYDPDRFRSLTFV